jgi:hypothetical protein
VSQFINQHSYFLVALVVLGVASLLLRRRRRVLAVVALLAMLVGAAAYLRTPGGDVRTESDVDRVLARGKPVALEFYSNF